MKSYYFILSISIASCLFASCSNEVNDVLEIQDEKNYNQDGIFIYDMCFESEMTSYEETTRATTAVQWKNGDVIYLRFSNGGSPVSGKAEYISSTNKWKVTCKTSLKTATNAKLEVWYGKGVNPKEEVSSGFSGITYDYLSEAYLATNGTYSYSGGITANAIMKPQGWRLRFKGASNTDISIYLKSFNAYGGIVTDSGYGFKIGSGSVVNMTVNADGYSDYFVVAEPTTSTRIIMSDCTAGDTFYRYIDSNTLKTGGSGYMTIPSTSALRGWTQSNKSSGTRDGHEYVDLGLTSGLKWAACNIGASSPTEVGNYYAWGETATKTNFSSTNYSYSGTSNLSGSSDAAYVNWGTSWRMPTKEEALELFNSCNEIKITLKGVTGYLYIGPNNKCFFLPNSGHYNGKNKYNADMPMYWTSSYSSSSVCYYFYDDYYGTIERKCGLPIRPVSSY